MQVSGSNGAPRRAVSYESLTVAVVARMVGVAPSTLRTWARRYGLEPSGHRSGLHRRYSESDVARLRYMRTLTQAGMGSKDAARRAMEASLDELATTPGTGPVRLDLGVPVTHGVPTRRAVVPGHSTAEVSPAVKTLLGTIGNADAQGAIALLRTSLRDLGAARTWDERIVPARGALWRLAPGPRARADRLLAGAAVGAVGEVRLRRERRNTVPVHVVAVPGHERPAATAVLRAALAERSIDVSTFSLGASPQAAARMVAEVVSGILVVHVTDEPVAAQLAGRLRQLGGSADQVHWGEGWVHWPGQAGGMVDLVRIVESASCPPIV